MKRDDFGDRMKSYEAVEAGRRFLPMLPVYARIDGKCFSSFTKGMDRPYDERMTQCMLTTTKRLVEETNAKIGYTQSDEISLCWYSDDPKSQIFFDGRIQKMTSILAAMASVEFLKAATVAMPDVLAAKATPIFDCRVFQLPTTWECSNAFLWRVKDAVKNSVSMAARSHYSHKALHGMSQSDMHEMLHRKGVNWNDYPTFFKEGVWYQRRKVEKELTPEELAVIPEKHRPTGLVERTEVQQVVLRAPFHRVINKGPFIFHGALPCYEFASVVDMAKAEINQKRIPYKARIDKAIRVGAASTEAEHREI